MKSTHFKKTFSSILIVILVVLAPIRILAQSPQISYIIPDIGTPGMNTYFEIIGPNNQVGNFGTDSIYLNNPNDAIQVVCANDSDTEYVRFGPCVVSWNGQMISTQAFVLPNVNATSTDWQQGIKIPVCAIVNGDSSNADTFYIVQPQNIGVNGTLFSVGALGSGMQAGTNWGLRSRRGAMIVDSLILNGNGSYTVSTQDCDSGTSGNQGYLPMVLISKGVITISSNAILSLSADGADGGPGGGGGGAGDTVAPGSGYCAGGNNCGFHDEAMSGTGLAGAGLNLLPSGGGNNCDQGGGGGSGHPFGLSGAMGLSGSPSQAGGYGGGSAGGETGNGDNHVNEFGGGGGGYSSFGQNGQGTGIYLGNNSGFPVGNRMIVPLAGGSAGGAGNQDAGGHGGSGGGGGGGLSLQSFTRCDIDLIRSDGSSGANGVVGDPNGLFPTSGAGGGGGTGGGLLVGGKLSLNSSSGFDMSGGSGGLAAADGLGTGESSDGGNGGAGRIRIDGPLVSTPIMTPDSASSYTGLSTDTQSFISKSFKLTGTGNGSEIRIYLKPLSENWTLCDSIIGYGSSWSAQINLPPGSDSIFLLAAAQQVLSPVSDTYTTEPSWVLSQAAANILRATTCDGYVLVEPSRDSAGDTVHLTLSLVGVGDSVRTRVLHLFLSFNTDLLSPISLTGSSCNPQIDSTTFVVAGRGGVICSVYYADSILIDTSCGQFVLSAKVMVTDSSSTLISIDSVTPDGSNSILLLSLCGPSEFDLTPGCGTQQLQQLMLGNTINVDAIIPNPATSSFTVSFSNAANSPIHYEIDDVLGRILTSGETAESQLALSASDLPAGVLLFRASSNGFVQTRQFVVVK